MNSIVRFFPGLLVFLVMIAPQASAGDGPVYELRTYTCEPGKLAALHDRFREHTMRIFEKHGMTNIAYWTPTDGERASNTLIYLLKHESRDTAKVAWAAFLNDPEWKTVAKKSREMHGKILAKAPESIFLKTTDYSPRIGPVDPAKTYELRIYVAAEGKLGALNTRFRNHTDRIFKRHGLKSIGYWVPVEGPRSNNTLVYILQSDNRDAARSGWKAFGQDPEWKTARAESEKNGRLLSKRPDSVYMKCTDYSPQPKPKR